MDNIGCPCVVLADGTQLLADVGSAGADAIWIWIRDAEDPFNNLVRLSQLLSNPDHIFLCIILPQRNTYRTICIFSRHCYNFKFFPMF